MRLQKGQKEEKGLIGFLFVINVADCSICQGIYPVARQVYGIIVVIINKGIVGSGGMLQRVSTQPPLIAASLFLRYSVASLCQMPFSDVSGVVARFIEVVCHGFMLFGQDKAVSIVACGSSILTGLKDCSGRSADGLGGKSILCKGAVRCHAVKVGGQIAGIVSDTGGIVTLLVCEEENNVLFHENLHFCAGLFIFAPAPAFCFYL